jgi:hypothetical protein
MRESQKQRAAKLLRQAHQKQSFEHQPDRYGRKHPDKQCLGDGKQADPALYRIGAHAVERKDGTGHVNRGRHPERQPVTEQHHAVATAQDHRQQHAQAPLALIFRCVGKRLMQRTPRPTAQTEYGSDNDHADAKEPRNQAGNGQRVDVPVLEPIHLQREDDDHYAEDNPAYGVVEIGAWRSRSVGIPVVLRLGHFGCVRRFRTVHDGLKAWECRRYPEKPWPCPG